MPVGVRGQRLLAMLNMFTMTTSYKAPVKRTTTHQLSNVSRARALAMPPLSQSSLYKCLHDMSVAL